MWQVSLPVVPCKSGATEPSQSPTGTPASLHQVAGRPESGAAVNFTVYKEPVGPDWGAQGV